MAKIDPDVPPLEESLAALERRLIDDYLRGMGQDPSALRQRTDDVARRMLTDASRHATLRLTEVESRAHYVRELHDTRR